MRQALEAERALQGVDLRGVVVCEDGVDVRDDGLDVG